MYSLIWVNHKLRKQVCCPFNTPARTQETILDRAKITACIILPCLLRCQPRCSPCRHIFSPNWAAAGLVTRPIYALQSRFGHTSNLKPYIQSVLMFSNSQIYHSHWCILLLGFHLRHTASINMFWSRILKIVVPKPSIYASFIFRIVIAKKKSCPALFQQNGLPNLFASSDGNLPFRGLILPFQHNLLSQQLPQQPFVGIILPFFLLMMLHWPK
jgi:hypothetical protein